MSRRVPFALAALLISGIVALGFGVVAFAAGSTPATVDFESRSGPTVFSTADPAITIGNLTVYGGQVLSAATFLPANQTKVYGTANFCRGCLPTLTLEFAKPVQNLRLDLINGETVTITYGVVSPGGVVIATLTSNLSAGKTRITIPDPNVFVVTISKLPASSQWDFFVDNLSFDVLDKSAKQYYETYKWYKSNLKDSAIKTMELKPGTFISEWQSAVHDPRLDWSTDLCSVPTGLVSVWEDSFKWACVRHDFGYRNFGQYKALDKTDARKSYVDSIFLADMNAVCKKQSSTQQKKSCTIDAGLFYAAVHSGGNSAFFG